MRTWPLLAFVFLSGCSHGYVALKRGSYQETSKKSLSQQLEESLGGPGIDVRLTHGPDKQLDLAVTGFVLGTYFPLQSGWDIDTAITALQYQKFETGVFLADGVNSTSFSMEHEVSGYGIDVSAGYNWGGLRPSLGLRRDSMSITTRGFVGGSERSSSTSMSHLYSVAGLEYRFFPEDAGGFRLRGEYATGVVKDSTTESVSVMALTLGYEWGSRTKSSVPRARKIRERREAPPPPPAPIDDPVDEFR